MTEPLPRSRNPRPGTGRPYRRPPSLPEPGATTRARYVSGLYPLAEMGPLLHKQGAQVGLADAEVWVAISDGSSGWSTSCGRTSAGGGGDPGLLPRVGIPGEAGRGVAADRRGVAGAGEVAVPAAPGRGRFVATNPIPPAFRTLRGAAARRQGPRTRGQATGRHPRHGRPVARRQVARRRSPARPGWPHVTVRSSRRLERRGFPPDHGLACPRSFGLTRRGTPRLGNRRENRRRRKQTRWEELPNRHGPPTQSAPRQRVRESPALGSRQTVARPSLHRAGLGVLEQLAEAGRLLGEVGVAVAGVEQLRQPRQFAVEPGGERRHGDGLVL